MSDELKIESEKHWENFLRLNKTTHDWHGGAPFKTTLSAQAVR